MDLARPWPRSTFESQSLKIKQSGITICLPGEFLLDSSSEGIIPLRRNGDELVELPISRQNSGTPPPVFTVFLQAYMKTSLDRAENLRLDLDDNFVTRPTSNAKSRSACTYRQSRNSLSGQVHGRNFCLGLNYRHWILFISLLDFEIASSQGGHATRTGTRSGTGEAAAAFS